MNTTRFLNVARWNFAINRSQYLKLSLGLFLAMSLPLLMFILKSVWVSAVTGNTEWALASIPGTSLGTWMSMCFTAALPLLAGYTFHNLLTKQSRIKELTLPATNGEKFLFHALATLGGAFLTYVVGYLMLDLLQYLYVGLVYGFSHAHWIPYFPILFDNAAKASAGTYFFGKGAIWVTLIGDAALIAFVSTFVLGNAIKYRHSVLWTILFHWVLGFASLFCIGLAMPLLIETDIDMRNIDPEQAVLTIKWGILLFFLLVTVFCWWMSYRLYCRAQITTKRNK